MGRVVAGLDEKACPECREIYTRFATTCADCDVELVAAESLPPEEALDLPPAAELECVRVAPLAWVRALSQGLQERGVDHRVERAAAEDAPPGQKAAVFGAVQLFGLYVRSEDAAPARELDGTIAAQLLPEEAPELSVEERESCPACGAALGWEATECPDCGLPFQ